MIYSPRCIHHLELLLHKTTYQCYKNVDSFSDVVVSTAKNSNSSPGSDPEAHRIPNLFFTSPILTQEIIQSSVRRASP